MKTKTMAVKAENLSSKELEKLKVADASSTPMTEAHFRRLL